MTIRSLNIALLSGIVLALISAITLGSTPLPILDVVRGLFGQSEPGTHIIIWEIRMPRALAAFLVGASLGLSGAALQGLLRNPLADPGVLGISSAASLGATATLFFGLSTSFVWATPLAAIVCAILATGILGLAAVRTQSVVTLILIGVGVSSLCGAFLALMMNFAPNPFSLADMVNWTMGTVANRSFDDLAIAAPFLAVGTMFLIASARGLDALTLGEEAAAGLGLNLARTRLWVVIGTGLVTGAGVSIGGAIGFVGLVAPHMVRPLVGHRPSQTLMPSALLAGLILILADIGVRVSPSDTELKLGVIAALIGAPVFIWIAARRRSTHG
jgi:iron complex transport system permease protein